MTEDQSAIRALVETRTAASKSGDVATILELMTDDVVCMVRGQEPFGREAFAEMSQAGSAPKLDGRSGFVELQVLGDWTFTRNCIEMTVTPPGREAVRRYGYTLTHRRKGADCGGWPGMRI